MPFEAAFQDLAANLLLLGAKSAVQVVTLASCLTGEGKTTVATHLAIASARAKRKVLLVDCGGQPAQIGPSLGLSSSVPKQGTFTVGESMMPEIRPLLDQGHLDLVQLSDLENKVSTGLIASSQFELFLKKWRTEYDLILLDTTAPLNAAEAKLASQHADGVLLVLKIGQTGRDVVDAMVKDFRTTSQTPILGLVANGVNLEIGR
jgi:Mrp family chromosome partitioning ATPase